MRPSRLLFAFCCAAAFCLPAVALSAAVAPQELAGPVAAAYALQPVATVQALALPALDVAGARQEDLWREAEGLPPRFALTETVRITPVSHGTWETLDGRFQLWRLRMSAPGALCLNLGFTAYRLPKGARLALYPADLTDVDDPRGLGLHRPRQRGPRSALDAGGADGRPDRRTADAEREPGRLRPGTDGRQRGLPPVRRPHGRQGRHLQRRRGLPRGRPLVRRDRLGRGVHSRPAAACSAPAPCSTTRVWTARPTS